MKKYKNKINNNLPSPSIDDEDKIDVHCMDVVVERVEGGLVGSLRIENDINKPIFKKGDFVLIRTPSKLQIKDFVLYHSHGDYFLRRIIKYKEDDIYVAGDNERAYHIIHREDIVGKVVSRERKNKRLSFSLTPKKKLYTFSKVKFAYFRLKNRVLDYEQESNIESLELAIQSAAEIKNVFENKGEIKYDIDLDSDLKSFLNPDTLVLELRNSMKQQAEAENQAEEYEEIELQEGEEIVYEEVDASEEEAEATTNEEAQEESADAVDIFYSDDENSESEENEEQTSE